MMYENQYQQHQHQQVRQPKMRKTENMRKSVSFNGRLVHDQERKSNIDNNNNNNNESVDLSGLSLESLPNPSLNLGVISKLDLSNNNIQIIPESLIARLLNVVVLDVHSNQLRSLPNSVGCLSKLKILNVSGNLIESIPRAIENCRSLEELNANFNKLEKLPDTIGFELHCLRKLSVNSNKLAYLPHSLSHLTALRVLDARLNCLRSLPEDLENLINLEVLNISQNFRYLQTVPYSVGLLLSLVELDVSYNAITALPDSISCLRRLKKLSVEGNPLASPPPEVMEQGIQAIKEYMTDRINNGTGSGSNNKSSSQWKKGGRWVGKLVKYGTFSAGRSSPSRAVKDHGYVMPEYRSIDGLASPGYMGMFSPRRLFSPRSYFTTKS